jgi:hypothetical protein
MHGLLKAHGGIMKMTAIQDYNCVKLYVIEKGFEVVEPKNTTKNRIENATAEMLHPMLSFPHYLNRGFSYYKSLIK